jgi:hypothetical protein
MWVSTHLISLGRQRTLEEKQPWNLKVLQPSDGPRDEAAAGAFQVGTYLGTWLNLESRRYLGR